MTAGPPPRRLPIDVVFRRSFVYAWESRAVLAAPAAIYAIVTVIADLLLGKSEKSTDAVHLFLSMVIQGVVGTAFAVGIHRFVLLREIRPGFRFFRWDRHFVQYLLTAVALFLLFDLAAYPMIGVAEGAAGPIGSAPAGASALFALAFMMTAAAILSRMALAMPSAALGDGTALRVIWDRTNGNTLRLIAVALLTMLPFALVRLVLMTILQASESNTTGLGLVEIVVTIGGGLVSSAQLVVGTVTLSLCYDALVRGGGPPVVGVGP
jgi:hypothetical protein